MTLSKLKWLAVMAAMVACAANQSYAQTVVASEDFDGNAVNLTSGFTTGDNLDGGGGDFVGIGSINAWPQLDEMGDPLGVPFSLLDESATNFEPDVEGIWSDQVSDRDNVFFGITDTREWTDDENGDPNNPLQFSWVFDISSATGPLQLSIDLAQCSNGASFDGFDEGLMHFEYSIDGGPFQTAFLCEPFDEGTAQTGFTYRNMDSGPDGVPNDPTEVFVCQATGPGVITKISAEDGTVSTNTILDKCVPAGSTGEGTIDTFITDIVGTGSSIEIRLTTHVAFEGMVFDNIVITEEEVVGTGEVTPDSYEIVTGVYATGDVTSVAESDNIDLGARRNTLGFAAEIEVEFKGTTTNFGATGLTFTCEGAVFSRRAITQQLSLFNYFTNEFEVIDVRPASRFSDGTAEIQLTQPISRFIEPGTGCVVARVLYSSTNRRTNFSANIDQVLWSFE